MKEKLRWAFILDKDEFVRLSLNKILKKYGFQTEEIEDFSQLEKRKNPIFLSMAQTPKVVIIICVRNIGAYLKICH